MVRKGRKAIPLYASCLFQNMVNFATHCACFRLATLSADVCITLNSLGLLPLMDSSSFSFSHLDRLEAESILHLA